MVEGLGTDFSVRQICETLGFNRSNLYYHPKQNPCEAGLQEEIEKLALLYPTYGYRRITKLPVRRGYTIGYKRGVSRLMKAANLSVSVKRVCQTTNSVEGVHPWDNCLENLDIFRCDQVWAGDITYVRLKRRFIYVAVLMDIFTRMIRGWQVSSHLKIHHSDQGVQYLPTAYISTLKEHGIQISLARRGHPWENGYVSDKCITRNAHIRR